MSLASLSCVCKEQNIELMKAKYEFALKRIEELLPVTPDCSPEDDHRMAEQVMMSRIVEEYETKHYPIA